jgi:hypothetical protein
MACTHLYMACTHLYMACTHLYMACTHLHMACTHLMCYNVNYVLLIKFDSNGVVFSTTSNHFQNRCFLLITKDCV